jgi:hypothetical protein
LGKLVKHLQYQQATEAVTDKMYPRCGETGGKPRQHQRVFGQRTGHGRIRKEGGLKTATLQPFSH